MRFDQRALITATALLLGAALPRVAAGDAIDLTTGERVRGTIKGTTATAVVIEVGGRERTIPQRLIRGLVFEPAGAPASPGVAAAKPPRAPARSPAARSVPPAAPKPEAKPAAAAPTEPDSAAAPAEPARIEARAVEPPRPAPPPRPALEIARVSPVSLREAMQALLDLRAAAVEGVSHADYATRTDDAKPRVLAYLSEAEGRADIKQAIESAMRLYSFAATAWSVYATRGDFAVVGRDPILGECPRLVKAIEEDAARWHFDAKNPGFAGMIAGSEGVPDLWACAANKLGEAEQLVAAQVSGLRQ
ncbi:MAG: hypothetical protein HY217_02755 [Candidatus Rokubacteria bacterium]|nr:hypothetical protein [Candidatus Rokubacteria bacterium]